MKKLFILFALLIAASSAFAADDGVIKLSLWDQMAVAAPNNKHDVTGLDFGIGSKTDSVTGLQLDLIWAETNYQLKGVSSAWLVNMANQVKGFQTAAFVKATDVVGVQLGAVNMTQSINGAQIAFYNQAEQLHGLQLGFINYAREINQGLQIGLLNIAENGYLPVMVFVNGRF